MHRYLKMGLFGFLLWLIPFVVSVLIFPLRAGQRPLFESIMPVVIAAWTVFFCILCIVWLFMSIVFDLLLFTEGPMKMTLLDYTEDIAITYLMIPAITFGFGYMREHFDKQKS